MCRQRAAERENGKRAVELGVQRHAHFQNVADDDADDNEGHGDERGCGGCSQVAAMHLPHDHDGGEQVKGKVSIHGALGESDGYECEPAVSE